MFSVCTLKTGQTGDPSGNVGPSCIAPKSDSDESLHCRRGGFVRLYRSDKYIQDPKSSSIRVKENRLLFLSVLTMEHRLLFSFRAYVRTESDSCTSLAMVFKLFLFF